MTSYTKENPHSSHQTQQPCKVSYKTRHGELYDSARRVIQLTLLGYKIYADERKYISSQIDIIIKILLRHFRLCDEEDSGLSDEEQKRKGPKNRPKHTRKGMHQDEKNFLEKFKTVSIIL